MNLSFIWPAFISFEELTVILLISVVIFGPKKIPEIARGLGEGIRAMKKATEEIKREIMDSAGDVNPVKDIQESIEDVKQGVKSVGDDIVETQKDVADSVANPAKDFKQSIDDAIGPVKRE